MEADEVQISNSQSVVLLLRPAPHSSSISLIWALVSDTDSQTPPRPTESGILGLG